MKTLRFYKVFEDYGRKPGYEIATSKRGIAKPHIAAEDITPVLTDKEKQRIYELITVGKTKIPASRSYSELEKIAKFIIKLIELTEKTEV